jgi:hypothetical protein
MRVHIRDINMQVPHHVIRGVDGSAARVASGPARLTLEAIGDWSPQEAQAVVLSSTFILAPLQAPERDGPNEAKLAAWAEAADEGRGAYTADALGLAVTEVYRLRDALRAAERERDNLHLAAKVAADRTPRERLVVAARGMGLRLLENPNVMAISLVPFDDEYED